MEWLTGLQVGKQPPLLGMSGFVPMLVDLRQMIMDDPGDLGRDFESMTAKPQAGLAVGDGHAVAGEADDPGEWLADHETSRPISLGVTGRSWSSRRLAAAHARVPPVRVGRDRRARCSTPVPVLIMRRRDGPQDHLPVEPAAADGRPRACEGFSFVVDDAGAFGSVVGADVDPVGRHRRVERRGRGVGVADPLLVEQRGRSQPQSGA